MSDLISVRRDAFDVAAELARLEALGGGAVASFVGQVRSDGPDFEALELEAYPAMAEAALGAIVATARERWPLLGVTLIHRYGRLAVGDRIVLVATASPHRAASLEACALLIDWTKTRAPFWKREWRRDGTTVWIEAKPTDEDAAAAWS
jgi:molybdopterin synthase catalytic subunit